MPIAMPPTLPTTTPPATPPTALKHHCLRCGKGVSASQIEGHGARMLAAGAVCAACVRKETRRAIAERTQGVDNSGKRAWFTYPLLVAAAGAGAVVFLSLGDSVSFTLGVLLGVVAVVLALLRFLTPDA